MMYLVVNGTASSAEVSWTLPTCEVQAASSGKVIAAVALGALYRQRMEERHHHTLPWFHRFSSEYTQPSQYMNSLTYSILLQEGSQALLLIPLIILSLPPCEVIAGDPSVLVLPLEGIDTCLTHILTHLSAC